MFKKTMIVVGAILAAALSMPDTATAAPHRTFHSPYFQSPYFHSRGIAVAARQPRRAFSRASFRPVRQVWGRHAWGRHAWGRQVASRGYHLARAARVAAITPRYAYGRRRVAVRSRAAVAYQAVPAPFAGLAPFSAPAPRVATSTASGGGQVGRASFYGGGGLTAAGGHVGAATCAHRSLPFGTRVLVTNLANARSTVLTVNDRGPFVRGRIVDVSVGAAGTLGMLHSGTAPVRVQVVGGPG